MLPRHCLNDDCHEHILPNIQLEKMMLKPMKNRQWLFCKKTNIYLNTNKPKHEVISNDEPIQERCLPKYYHLNAAQQYTIVDYHFEAHQHKQSIIRWLEKKIQKTKIFSYQIAIFTSMTTHQCQQHANFVQFRCFAAETARSRTIIAHHIANVDKHLSYKEDK